MHTGFFRIKIEDNLWIDLNPNYPDENYKAISSEDAAKLIRQLHPKFYNNNDVMKDASKNAEHIFNYCQSLYGAVIKGDKSGIFVTNDKLSNKKEFDAKNIPIDFIFL